MRILFVTAWWPNRQDPRFGNFIEKYARLVARRHDLTVVNVAPDNGLAGLAVETVEHTQDGYRVMQVYYPERLGIAGRGMAWSSVRRRLKKPEIVHGHILIDGGIFAAAWATSWGVPYVISEHASAHHRPGYYRGIAKWLGRRAAKGAAFMLPVSAHLGRSMREIGKFRGRYRVLGNVVDTEIFAQRPALPTRPERLLHVSNFNERDKNITGLLEGFRIARARHERLSLHLAGDGDRAALESLLATTGLSRDHVTLSGPHTEAEIAALLQTADAFILPSHVENQPVVLLEALCCGLPCVATAVGGITEVIATGENGVLVDRAPASGEDVASGISELIALYPTFNAESIRQKMLALCSEAAIGKALDEIYERSLSDKFVGPIC